MAALWEQRLVAEHGAATAYALAATVALAVGWWIRSLWVAGQCSYNLQLLWEYTFLSVPEIVLEDLPSSVTQDDGVKSEAGASSSKAANKRRIDAVKGQIQCYDPSTQQYLGHVPAMNAPQVHELCVKAAAAQREWRHTSYAQRRMVLRTLQTYILRHIPEICRVAARDSGKPAVDACLGEVLTTCEKIRTLCASGELWLRPDAPRHRTHVPAQVGARRVRAARCRLRPLRRGIIRTYMLFVVVVVVGCLHLICESFIGWFVHRASYTCTHKFVSSVPIQFPQFHEPHYFGHFRGQRRRW